MIRFSAALLTCALLVTSVQAATVTVGDSSAPWIGFMNVSNLPAPDGDGAFQFGSSWGVPDLTATFDDPNSQVIMSPNTIGDPNEYWYQGGRPGEDPGDPNDNGGPGALGNKIMEANLFIQESGTLDGQTLTFEGEVLSDTTTAAHAVNIFIRDFASDFSSFNETIIPATVGPFSISLAIDPGPGRNVQYGFQMVGENVWVTDTAPFGNVVFGPSATEIPEPATVLLVGAGLLGFVGSRRRS